jgi:hypothetical protein
VAESRVIVILDSRLEGGPPMKGWARSTCLLVIVAAAFGGCSAITATPTEYDLTFRPVTGMRLAHDVSMEVSASDGQERKSAPKQSSKRVINIVAADTESYSVRVSVNGTAVPFVMTMMRDGTLKRLAPDNPNGPAPTEEQVATASTMLKDAVGAGLGTMPWRVGSSREVALRIPVGAAKGSEMKLRATLRRITKFERRPAAELTLDGAGTIAGQGSSVPVLMSISGIQWTDLQTGAVLLSTMTATGQSNSGGRPVDVEMKQEERLNLRASAGL